MLAISAESFAEAYSAILNELEHAPAVMPRSMLVKEKLAISFQIRYPRTRLALSPGRRWNLSFAVAEFLWVASGRNDLEYIRPYNSRMAEFSDDGMTFYGSYGARWDAVGVELKLREDRNSRQAVTVIWRPEDTRSHSKDIPCTVCWQFLIRDDQLHMIATMRSNDAIWGLPYNVFVNTMIQEWLACRLEVGMGTYVHQVGSMHIYQRHWETMFGRKWQAVRMESMYAPTFVGQLYAVEKLARGAPGLHQFEEYAFSTDLLLKNFMLVLLIHWRRKTKQTYVEIVERLSPWAQRMLADQYGHEDIE